MSRAKWGYNKIDSLKNGRIDQIVSQRGYQLVWGNEHFEILKNF